MKKFEILRYVKRFSVFILLLAIIGSYAIYIYGKNNQQYTATAIIKYTNDGIVEGYTPDGTKLDVNEIYSTEVIVRAMNILGLKTTPEIIRSHCAVTPVISEEQQMTNEALADKGEEVTYFPDTYKIELMVDGEHGAGYARDVLDAIIESYFSIYTEKYVEHRLSDNPSVDLLEKGYDYYQCICMLDEDTQNMIDFLSVKKESYPQFRSSVTGYTFNDLYEIYDSMQDYDVPRLYAQVLDGPQVKNAEYLRKALSDEIKNSKNEEAVKIERKDYLRNIIDNFSDKNEDILDYHFKGQIDATSDTKETEYILKDVYEDYYSNSKETTYDEMIIEYVSLDKSIKEEAIKRDDKQFFLSVFEDIETSSGDEASHEALEKEINDYQTQLANFYKLVNDTSEELNRYLAADYFQIQNSVNVHQKINIQQYVMLAILFFLVVGILGAIVVGRGIDIVEYFLYIDKKTGLPNRESCDTFMTNMSKSPLPDNYSCFVFELSNLNELNKKFGYSVGNNVLKDFAGLLNSMFSSNGKVFHNNKGVFLAFMDQCSDKKAQAVIKTLDEYIEEYNSLNPDYAMKYKGTYTTSTEEGIYSIRQLIGIAFSKIKEKDQNYSVLQADLKIKL